jgi:hypothetical protein
MRGSALESTGPSQGLSTTAYCHYGGVGGLHTRISVHHVWCMSVCARLNLAVSKLCWDLSGVVLAFRVMNARPMIYTLQI